MKLSKLLLRWYKSFHLNYRGALEKGETQSYRPWNKLSPPFAQGVDFPFIEIPIERDITTIVGANESGKSHILNALSKVVRGTGVDSDDPFGQTDLCHYAGIRTRNVEAWPNIGLQFTVENELEMEGILAALDVEALGEEGTQHRTFTLLLAPDEDEQHPAKLFIEPGAQPISLKETQLAAIRETLPRVQFIDSKALLASELPLAHLIAASSGERLEGISLGDRRAVEAALRAVNDLPIPVAQQAASPDLISKLQA